MFDDGARLPDDAADAGGVAEEAEGGVAGGDGEGGLQGFGAFEGGGAGGGVVVGFVHG